MQLQRMRKKGPEPVWGSVYYDIDSGIGRPINTLFTETLMWLVSSDNLKAREGHYNRAKSLIDELGVTSIFSSLFHDEFPSFTRALAATGIVKQAVVDTQRETVAKRTLEEEFWTQPLLFSEKVDLAIADGYLEFCVQQAEAKKNDPNLLSPVLFAYDFVFTQLNSPLEQIYLQRFMYVATSMYDADSEIYLLAIKKILQDFDLDKFMEPLTEHEKKSLIADLEKFGVLPDERSFA